MGNLCSAPSKSELQSRSSMVYGQPYKGVIFETLKGDIVEIDAEAIVNGSNLQLANNNGLASNLVAKGGQTIQAECNRIRESDPDSVKIGNAVVTTGGNLKAKHIIHVITPIWNNGTSGEEQQLAECVNNALTKANKLNVKSIAVPSLDGGAFGFPKEKAAEIIVQTCISYIDKYGPISTSNIKFINTDGATVKVFKTALQTSLNNKEAVSVNREESGVVVRGNFTKEVEVQPEKDQKEFVVQKEPEVIQQAKQENYVHEEEEEEDEEEDEEEEIEIAGKVEKVQKAEEEQKAEDQSEQSEELISEAEKRRMFDEIFREVEEEHQFSKKINNTVANIQLGYDVLHLTKEKNRLNFAKRIAEIELAQGNLPEEQQAEKQRKLAEVTKELDEVEKNLSIAEGKREMNQAEKQREVDQKRFMSEEQSELSEEQSEKAEEQSEQGEEQQSNKTREVFNSYYNLVQNTQFTYDALHWTKQKNRLKVEKIFAEMELAKGDLPEEQQAEKQRKLAEIKRELDEAEKNLFIAECKIKNNEDEKRELDQKRLMIRKPSEQSEELLSEAEKPVIRKPSEQSEELISEAAKERMFDEIFREVAEEKQLPKKINNLVAYSQLNSDALHLTKEKNRLKIEKRFAEIELANGDLPEEQQAEKQRKLAEITRELDEVEKNLFIVESKIRDEDEEQSEKAEEQSEKAEEKSEKSEEDDEQGADEIRKLGQFLKERAEQQLAEALLKEYFRQIFAAALSNPQDEN